MKKQLLTFVLLLFLMTQTKAQTTDTISATYNGTNYSGYTRESCGVGCLETLAIVLPPDFIIENITLSNFYYQALGTCTMDSGGFSISLGSCTDGCHTCALPLAGLCELPIGSIFNSVQACLPPPKCISDTLNFVLNLFRNTDSTSGCGISCLYGAGWTILVIGKATPQVHIQTTTQQQHGDSVSICAGSNIILTAIDSFGIAPLTIIWNPGGIVGDSINVTATSDTTYIAIVTDSCGDIATDTIHIIPVICEGIESYSSNGFSISPNPATNQLTIHTSSFHNETVMVSVVNVLGQETLSPISLTPTLSKGERDATIDVSALPVGMYFVEMKMESGSVVKRFVKE